MPNSMLNGSVNICNKLMVQIRYIAALYIMMDKNENKKRF